MENAELADLTDAVARGRLTLAELATLSGEELDALHGIAVSRLDTGRDQDARTLLAALVTLFPFRARFWRAYGVALQRCGDLKQALAAYDAALLFDPDHGLTRCHHAEVAFLLGEQEHSARAIYALIDHPDKSVGARALALWQVVNHARRPALEAPTAGEDAQKDSEVYPVAEQDTFTLTDGRTLPLENSRYDALEEPQDEDVLEVPPEDTQAVYRTNTAALTPLPELTGAHARPEGTVVTAVERRVHGWPLADDEITLTASGPNAPPAD